MPVYNAGRFLHQAISSILAQTLSDLELIIIDDGSTDDSVAVVREFDDARIYPVSREHRGISATRNECLALARGEFVAFMDADDLCHPERLAIQVAHLRNNPRLGMAGTWADCVDEHGRPAPPFRITPPAGDISLRLRLLSENPFTNGSAMFRRLCAGDLAFQPELDPTEDYDFWLRFAERNRIGNVPRFLYTHRRHAASASHRSGVPANLATIARVQSMAVDRLLSGADCLHRSAYAEAASASNGSTGSQESMSGTAYRSLCAGTWSAFHAGDHGLAGELVRGLQRQCRGADRALAATVIALTGFTETGWPDWSNVRDLIARLLADRPPVSGSAHDQTAEMHAERA